MVDSSSSTPPWHVATKHWSKKGCKLLDVDKWRLLICLEGGGERQSTMWTGLVLERERWINAGTGVMPQSDQLLCWRDSTATVNSYYIFLTVDLKFSWINNHLIFCLILHVWRLVVTCLHGASSSSSSVKILTLRRTYSVIHTYQNVCLDILGGRGSWHPFPRCLFQHRAAAFVRPAAISTGDRDSRSCWLLCAVCWLGTSAVDPAAHCTALNLVALCHLIFVAVSVFVSLHSSLPRVPLMRIVVTAIVAHSNHLRWRMKEVVHIEPVRFLLTFGTRMWHLKPILNSRDSPFRKRQQYSSSAITSIFFRFLSFVALEVSMDGQYK